MPAAPTMDLIMFGDLCDGSIRLTPPLLNGQRCLSIRDYIMVRCGKDCDDAGKIWRRLNEERKAEIESM